MALTQVPIELSSTPGIVDNSNATAITIDSSERIGIGTTSPAAKIHLKDTTGTAVKLLQLETAWSSPSGNKSIEWTDSVNTLGRISVDYTAPKASMRFGSLYNSGYQTGDVMTLTADGNVGIGTGAPGCKVDIVAADNTSLSPTLRVNSNNVAVNAALAYDGLVGSGEFELRTSGASALKFGTNATERMRILSGGNVLIGRSSEPYVSGNVRLHVEGPLPATDGRGQMAIATTAAYNATDRKAMLNFSGAFDTVGTPTYLAGIAGEKENTTNNNYGGALTLHTRPNGAALAERMRITSAGNVGIGTSIPSDVLHVVGPTINLERQSNGAGFGAGLKFSLGDSASTTANHNYASIFGVIEDNTNGAEDGYLSFQTSLSGSVGERLRIHSSGNTFLQTGGAALQWQNGYQTITGDASSNDLTYRTYQNHIWKNTTGASSTTDGTERMRIDSGGNLFVGKTAASFSTDGVTIFSNGQTNMTAQLDPLSINRKGSSGNAIGFYINTAICGSISVTTGSTSYNTSSDYRLKENVVALTGATERLKQLNPSRFNFIADPDSTVDGFLAHEVQDVVPESITGTHNEVDDDGNPVYQGIDQSKLVPLLVATIQELEARITQLENN